MLNIGEYVQREKNARGWTLEQLGELTGIRAVHLSRLIHRPPQTPDADTVKKIAGAFQVAPGDVWRIISGDVDPAPLTLDRLISARISRHLAQLPRDKQERAVQALERTAIDYAELLASAH